VPIAEVKILNSLLQQSALLVHQSSINLPIPG